MCISRGKESSDKERIKENEEAKERKLLIMWLMVHGVKGSYWFKSVDVGFQGWFWRPNELHSDKGSFSLRLVVFTFSFWKKDAYSRKTHWNYIDSWLSLIERLILDCRTQIHIVRVCNTHNVNFSSPGIIHINFPTLTKCPWEIKRLQRV